MTPATRDVVWIRKRRWRVEHVRLAERVGAVDVAAIDGTALGRTFLTPFDRAWPEGRRERLRRVNWRQARARLLAMAARAGTVRLPLTALDAAVDILPFQLEASLAFVHGARRVLIADAVGLGKTIQAGLVVAEVVRRTVDPWVLVLVPGSLCDQWTAEISGRFHLDAAHADAETLRRLAADAPRGESPWRAGVWIASVDFLKQPHVFDGLPLRAWDLVVIDEAHDVAGPSDRHAACDALARRARRVLLLTATPHNGDRAAFDRLCRLGRWPAPAPSSDRLAILRRTPASLGWTSARRVRWHRITPSTAEAAALDTLRTFEGAVLGAAGDRRRDAAVLLLSVFRKRALSTMAALAASLRRRAAWLDGSAALEDSAWQQPRLEFGEMEGDALAPGDDLALAADVGLDRSREQAWLRRLTALAERAAVDESRIRRLAGLLARAREPVVVFTEFRDSLAALVRHVERTGPVAVLHGGQSTAERRSALASYLNGHAAVVAATDVAGQGLNLQSRGRWVVNFDLPWNPARLAQRAGRVDRIGQARPVHVTLLSTRHAAESEFLRRLSARALRAGNALDFEMDDARWPDEGSVGEAIIAGRSAESRPAPVIAADVTWRRHAHWAARSIVRRRRWAAEWRSRDEWTTRPMMTRRPGGRGGAAASAWMLVFATPIADAGGTPLDTHLGACRVWTTGADAPASALADLIGPRVALRAERRAARVQRWLEQRNRDAAQREHVLARELDLVRLGRLPQPGLFDRTRPPFTKDTVASRPGNAPQLPNISRGRVALVAAIALDR